MGGLFEFSQLQRRWQLMSLTAVLGIIVLLFFSVDNHRPPPRAIFDPVPPSQLGVGSQNHATSTKLVKPTDIRVIGLVFFGRKDRVQILRCYLERNLAVNGGWLDEVQWVRNTDKEDDIAYLHEIIASTPSFKQIDIKERGFAGFGLAWSAMEDNAIYVKIDDDVVFMADDAIPRMVTTKLAHPEYLLVSANMINSPLMGWMHYHMGAIQPYLPEYFDIEHGPPIDAPPPGKKPPPARRIPWRYNEHPQWEGPSDYFFSFEQKSPSMGHRWLRLPTTTDNMVAELRRTPISDSEYATWGNSLKSWAIAAQQHYSFLENLANDQLQLYQFSEKALPWVTDYMRLSINLIAVNSTEIKSHLPMDTGDDEEWLTKRLPKKIKKSIAVDTHAIATHFSFGVQKDVASTDLLGRYLDYAVENACLAVGTGPRDKGSYYL